MPTGPRIRGNNSFGVTTDNPLTAGAVTFNSAGLATLPVVSSAHAVVVLDPKRLNGEPEIVVVTAHSSLATVSTVQRGQYGTVARSHPQGTPWAHVPVDEDYIEILTSGTRPSNPYKGQFIFEADTNKLVGYGGVDWAPRDAGGQLGYAQVTANQSFTTLVDLTGLSVAVTVGTGRRIKVTGFLYMSSNTLNDGSLQYIYEDLSNVARAEMNYPIANRGWVTVVMVVRTPTAGPHTYKLAAERSAGAGTITSNAGGAFPAFILVEDIGAA